MAGTSIDDQMKLFRSHGDVVTALAWDRESVSRKTSLRTPVDKDVLVEFRAYLDDVEVRPELIEKVVLDDVDLPLMIELGRSIRDELITGCGFTVISGLDQEDLTEPELRLFYVLCCLSIGRVLTNYGRQHDVTDRGLDFRSVDVSVSKTRVKAPFHTDSTSLKIFPNAFGLLCVRPAMSGGQSMLVNGLQVYRGLAEREPEHLRTLFRHYIRNTVTPGDEQVDVRENAFPVFSWGLFSVGPTFRYMRHWIETGYQKANIELDRASVAAFDALDRELHRPENILSIDLRAGEILLLNNAWLAHNRSEFVDYPDGTSKRLLVRTWLSVPDGDGARAPEGLR